MTDGDGRAFDRRELLVRGALVAGASTVAGAGGFVLGRETAAASDPPGASEAEHVNLTTFLLAGHPASVQGEIERHRRGLDTNAALYLQRFEVELEEAARTAVAEYVEGDPDDVALTDSTTMGLGLVYGRMRLRNGDEIVTTEHDFYATHEALRLRAALDGVRVRRIRLYEQPQAASVDEIVSSVVAGIGPRTRALALTWVHSSTGVKLPLREIADAVAGANGERILIVVDGVHGFGVEDVSPSELGADIFVSGCHKWLFGPRGTGFVWAAPHAWDELAPTIPSFDGRAYLAWIQGREPTDTPPGPLMTPGGFHSFEHRWALPPAFRFHEALGGRTAVADATHGLASWLKNGLAEIRGVTLRTPTAVALSAGLVCVEVDGIPAVEAVDRLWVEHRIVASATPYATRYLRLGPSVLNTEDDIDRVLEAVAAIARA